MFRVSAWKIIHVTTMETALESAILGQEKEFCQLFTTSIGTQKEVPMLTL